MIVFNVLDAASMWTVFWCSLAGLMAAQEVRTWRELVLAASQLGLMVSSFAGGISVYVFPGELVPWMRGFAYAAAALALWLYDRRFGLQRHGQMLMASARCLLGRRRGRHTGSCQLGRTTGRRAG